MKHTPGPWTLEAGRNIVTQSGEFYITYGQDRYKNPKFKDFCELDANAHLIAAAPDMLEALRELTRLVHQNNAIQHAGMEVDAEAWADMYQAVNVARAVIAKAQG